MRRIFVEYTCVRDKYTGIGKTVSVLCSAMEEVGVETRGGYYDHSGALKVD